LSPVAVVREALAALLARQRLTLASTDALGLTSDVDDAPLLSVGYPH